MSLLKCFLQKVRKHYFIIICLLIISSSIISSLVVVFNVLSKINQYQRIAKFQNDYLYSKISSFQLIRNAADIAVNSDNEFKCVDAELEFMHNVDSKDKKNNFIDVSFKMLDACKME